MTGIMQAVFGVGLLILLIYGGVGGAMWLMYLDGRAQSDRPVMPRLRRLKIIFAPTKWLDWAERKGRGDAP